MHRFIYNNDVQSMYALLCGEIFLPIQITEYFLFGHQMIGLGV